MSDVDLTVGADTSAAAAGFAELQNYAVKARTDITRSFAGGIAVTALISSFDSVINKLHDISHESERFGIDPEQLQLISNAAAEEGISIQQVARAMNLLEINGQKALDPMSKQAAALQQLGIEATSFAAMNPADKFLAVAGAYQASAQDGAAYAAVAQLIGTRNTELLTTLSKTPEQLAEISREMGIFDDATVKAGAHVYELEKQLLSAVQVQIGGPIVDFIDFLGKNIANLLELVKELWAWFSKLTTLDFSGAAAAGSAFTSSLINLPGKTFDLAKGLGQELLPSVFGAPEPTPSLAPGQLAPEGGFTGTGALDTSARAAGGGGGGGGSSEESLLARIAKIEEESIAQQLTDEEQLVHLQGQQADLVQKKLALDEAAHFLDTKGTLQAELALDQNQLEINKLSEKIENDKAAAAKKVTDEREKEEATAQQSLADARESNLELQLELSGRQDLAERAKIQYDYEQKISDARAQAAYDEEQVRQAAEAGDTEEVAKWQAVLDTNKALVDQLSLEEQNALAAHDKATAEKQAAARQEAVQEAVAEDRKLQLLQLETAGRRDLAEQLKVQWDYQDKIKDLTEQINEAWSEGDQVLAEQLTNIRSQVTDEEALAQAALARAQAERNARELSRSQATTLSAGISVQEQQGLIGPQTAGAENKSIALQQKSNDLAFQIAAAAASGNDLQAQQLQAEKDQVDELASLAENDVFAARERETGLTIGQPGTDALGRMAAMGISIGGTAQGLASPRGVFDPQLYLKYYAQQQIMDLQGGDWGWYQRAEAAKNLQLAGALQQTQATAAATKAKQDQLAYWEAVAVGQKPPSSNFFTSSYGATPTLNFGPQPTTPNLLATTAAGQPLSSFTTNLTTTQLLQQILVQQRITNQKLSPKPGG